MNALIETSASFTEQLSCPQRIFIFFHAYNMHTCICIKAGILTRHAGTKAATFCMCSASVNMLKSDRAFLSSVSPHIMPCMLLVEVLLLLYLLCLLGCLKVSVVSSVEFIPSLLSNDVSQVGLLQLEELTRLQWSSNESLARNLLIKSGRRYNYRSRCHYIPLQETYMFM